MVVAFSSLVRIWEEGLMIHSPPALSFFFLKWRSAHAYQFHLFRPGLIHNGSAGWNDCGQVFPDKLRVSLFSLIGSQHHVFKWQVLQKHPIIILLSLLLLLFYSSTANKKLHLHFFLSFLYPISFLTTS